VKELVGASTSILILGTLQRGPSYGYDIVRTINEQAEGIFTWQEGTVYPLLHKLEESGLVKSRWQETAAGRKRKYYSLTPAGHQSLEQGTRQWKSFHELVLRLSGAGHARLA